ncbi:RNA polymerase sigma factor [Actinomadura macra]|uniref:RNA polymerase sigma factor n=1 Tax=Actinomadura macra TaxID=46164 RepID=UPI000AD3A0EE|nr:sigma-70 family RNA polymerase sigma factor [Actinomadura macra]
MHNGEATSPATSSGVKARPTTLPDWFEQFGHGELRRLIKAAMAAGASSHDAQDAVSQVLADMVARARRGERIDHPTAYARRAVINAVKYQAQRERNLIQRLVSNGYCLREGADDDTLSRLENAQTIEEALRRLPPAQREVLGWVIKGLSPVEIAERTNKTPDTVRQNLRHARRTLRSQLQKVPSNPPSPLPDQPSTSATDDRGEESR